MDYQNIIFIIFIIFFIILIGLIIYLIILQKRPQDNQNSLNLIQDHIFNLSKTFDNKISETNKTLENKLGESSKMITDNMSKTFETSAKINREANKQIEAITKKLTQLEETNKQIKDIGGQLSGLENILKNPKQRGNLGEYFLKELLENVFTPDQYKLQYTIKGVGIVDAVLFIGGKIIPIDSKFPQENYERVISSKGEHNIKKYSSELKKDITNRINETSKYIAPEKNTTDFAFMLIPAEGLYYDLFINKIGNLNVKKLIEYAFTKKVIICSPSSFYAYLQTVLQGMKALQIEEQAIEIQQHVIKLQKDLKKYEQGYEKIGRSLSATVNHYNDSYKRLGIIDKDIIKITKGKAGGNIKLLEIEKPDI